MFLVILCFVNWSISFWNSSACDCERSKGINNRKLWISNRFLVGSNHFSCGYRESINYLFCTIDKSTTPILSMCLFYSTPKYSCCKTSIIKWMLTFQGSFLLLLAYWIISMFSSVLLTYIYISLKLIYIFHSWGSIIFEQ